jgi:hypothetical protein
MKRGEFVTTVANITGLSDSVVLDVLEASGDVLADLLREDKSGEAASVPGFGKFAAPCVSLDKSLMCGSLGDIGYHGDGRPLGRVINFAPGKSFRRMFIGRR